VVDSPSPSAQLPHVFLHRSFMFTPNRGRPHDDLRDRHLLPSSSKHRLVPAPSPADEKRLVLWNIFLFYKMPGPLFFSRLAKINTRSRKSNAFANKIITYTFHERKNTNLRVGPISGLKFIFIIVVLIFIL